MSAPKEMWEAFLGWCHKEVDEREKEIAPLKDGSMRVGRTYGGEWVDITKERIAQIEREIASLENTIKEYTPYAQGS